ncbi:MAG: hypothetical protein H2040_12330 [Euryhalocaulis sp.]|uniref:hypothetical protein n=1 Tax=Euryhalocaulis sp. TaxID=2744307 RepID=UPI0017B4DDC7|nr:hypothetical protein [Euryhalocaulis sp.]MBA4802639.1 hypothetical protein [Euryhalocaulis sp.]
MIDNDKIKGDPARLFPVVADTSKEGRALSIFLACMTNVFEFGQNMLGSVGQRVGSRAKMAAYCEVKFPKDKISAKDRPDGLLILKVGSRTWSALFEAKVGRATINPEQMDRYVRLAQRNGIDAVISISNEFATFPDQPPYNVPNSIKTVSVYHWSWMHIMTEANLLSDDDRVTDKDQGFILREFLRYLRHDSTGASGFDQMNAEWSDLVSLIQKDGIPKKGSPEIENTIAAWHQETRDLELVLSRKTGRNVELRIPRAHQSDRKKRLKDDTEQLVTDKFLSATFAIPDAAAPLEICANLATRTIQASMRLKAPLDKKSASARINWLLKQIKTDHEDENRKFSIRDEDLSVRAIWPGSAPYTQKPLPVVREDIDSISHEDRSKAPTSFEVLMSVGDGRSFGGRQKFIQLLEESVPDFYELVGQNLKPWQAPAPKVRKSAPDEDELQDVDLSGRDMNESSSSDDFGAA